MKLNEFQQQFLSLYGAPAQGIAAAPGRVNLIGEFTDYNDGFVLPCSLAFRTQVMFKQRDDNIITVRSLNYPGEQDRFSVDEAISEGQSQWGNYIRAVAFVLKRAGHTLRGADLLIDSNLPQGSGLSSSAALEVAVGGMFNHIAQLGLPPEKIALFGQEAENDFMHCQCGIMDQLISAKGENGHALLIDCENLATTAVKVPDDLNIVIVNSNYPRKLVDSEYNQRRIDCEQAAVKMGVETLRQATMTGLQAVKATLSENEYKRTHHVISENDRVIAATTALQNNDMDALRTLMAASHQSLKHDFEVTVPATDGLVEICKEAMGERGAVRMTGGGFGGAIVCLCRDAEVPLIKAAIEKHYFERFSLNADIYVCSAGSGLQITSF
ncbi:MULTISPECIES: galactokinase [Pseudoalteromonas]|uniref:Galactokinase n=1 Tax=Pseudoalteromonas fuliginea TaxID=1872678 RepID=A0ABQ6RJA9_9GAMM|nr:MULTISPECIES: galactokinase [Pseudoalteromonas]KAA1158222.1 galactokinase [Pseudoalteromonas fuliginea]KAA1167816.1 galactokinase [Pseudoalteromonas fuliginea]GAA77581.1 galactokinase [Pseudoalteromonas sp. BSi20495]